MADRFSLDDIVGVEARPTPTGASGRFRLDDVQEVQAPAPALASSPTVAALNRRPSLPTPSRPAVSLPPAPASPPAVPRAVALTEGLRAPTPPMTPEAAVRARVGQPPVTPQAPTPTGVFGALDTLAQGREAGLSLPSLSPGVGAAYAVARRVPGLRQVTEGVVAGTAGLGESAIGALHALGAVPDEWLTAAQDVSRLLTPETATRRIAEDPAGTILDPSWWATQAGTAIPSIVSLGSVGAIARALTSMRFAAPVAAAVAESIMEGGSAYSEARASGASPADAAKAAAKVVAANLPLLAASNVPVFGEVGEALGRGGRIGLATASEAAQEATQAGISNLAARGYDPDRPITEGMLEGAVVGGMVGAGASALAGRRPQAPVGQPPITRPTRRPLVGGDPARLAAMEARAAAAISADDVVAVEPPPVERQPSVSTVTTVEPDAAPAGAGLVGQPVAVASPAEVQPGGYYVLPPDAIKVDPARFQFKGNADREGVTASARIEGPWQENRAGAMLVWKDPDTGELYIVNGHHRLEAAKRLGAPRVVVKVLEPMTAQSARVEGALTNIAEDKGTAVDAAKVIRGGQYTREQLGALGINPRTKLAREGLALAQLSDPLFQRVAQGELDEGLGVAIGEANLSPEAQAAVVQLVERQQAKGREITPGQVRALIQDVASAPTVEAESDQGNMFVDLLGEDRAQTTAIEKATLRDWLMTTLAKDRRLFGFVAKGDRAERLAAAGNVIDAEASQQRAAEAGQVQAVVEKLAFGAGPVNTALNAAATRLAQGDDANAVRSDLLAAVREAVRSELRPGGLPTGRSGSGSAVHSEPDSGRLPPDPAGPGRVAPVARVTGVEFGDESVDLKTLRARAIAFFDRVLRGQVKSVERPGFGVIHFTREGRDKVKAFSADPDKLRSIPALPDVLRDGVYLGAEAPRAGSGPNIRAVHRFDGDVSIGNRTVRVQAVVLEDQEGNKFYDHFTKQQAPTNPPAQRRGSGPGADGANADGASNIAQPGRKGNRGGSTQGEPMSRQDVDLLSTGEQQPRLPGDVGAVRDLEVAHPTLGPEPGFDLTQQADARPEDQGTLFGTPVRPKKGPAKVGKSDRGGQGALFESVQQSQGSPTRQLYVPRPVTAGTTPVTRPMSEHETVNKLREIFSVDRVTPTWLRMVLGTARAAYPTRVGKAGRNALGHYQLDSGLIRLRRAADLATMAHEVGHMISFRLFGRTPPVGLFKDEIMRLGLATTPPSKVGTKYNFEEGIAEYFRIWFAEPTQAHQQAPHFTQALETWMQEHPAAAAQLLAAQTVVRRYNAQSASVRGRARVNVRPAGVVARAKSVVQEMRAKSPTVRFAGRLAAALRDTGNLPKALRDPHAWFDTMLTHWVDRHTAMKRAVLDMAAGEGGAVDVTRNAYVLTRLADGASGMAEGMLRHGPRSANGQFAGPGLQAVLSPIRHRLYPSDDRTGPDFVTYLVALRAAELHTDGKNRWPGLTRDEAAAIIAETHADPEAQLFVQAAKGVHAYLKGLRQYAREYGLITPQLEAKLGQALFYVPLQRVMDDAADRLSGAARTANRTSPIKRLKGSGRDIIDPLESIVKNTEALVNAVEKNRAAAALVKQAAKSKHSADWLVRIPTPQVATRFNLKQVAKDIEDELNTQLGITLPATQGGRDLFDRLATVFLPATFGDPSQRIITVVEQGQRVFYQVQDEALYQNLTNVGIAPTGELVKWAAKPTALLRAGATLRPSFIIRNLLRDTVGAMLQSRYGFVPVYDTIRGLASMAKGDESYRQFQAFGIQSSSFLGQDRDRARHFIDQISQPTGFKAKVRLAVHPVQALRYLSEQVEVATRLGEFRLALEAGGRERRAGVLGIAQRVTDRTKGKTPITERSLTTAALAARDVTVDFARGGRTAKELSQFKAFFNARAQGYVRIAETFSRDPIGTTLTVGMLAALGAALWVLNRDDEEYQELSAQQKRDYWFIKLPGNDWFLTIPKPFEWALVPNIVEAALDEHLSPSDVMSVSDAKDLVWQLVPTGVLPFVEALANYSSFTRRSIVSPYDTGLDPDLQVRESTSDTARLLAYPVGVSPAKLEHLLYGFGGGLARDAVGLIDPASRLLAARGRPPKPQPPITRRVPGLAAIVRETAYDSGAQSIQDFYDELSALEQAERSLRQREQGEGLRDAAEAQRAFVERFPLERAERLREAKRLIDTLREDIAEVRGAPAMTPPQKAEEIRAIHEAMVDVARRALGRPPLQQRRRYARREAIAAAP